MGGRKFRGAGGVKEKWGPGAQWDKVESFEVGRFGEQSFERDRTRKADKNHIGSFELIHGQHPHSRSDNNMYARVRFGTTDEAKVDPVPFSGTRLRTRVEVHEYNYLKSSGISGDEIREMCQCTIYFFDVPVYGFHRRKATDALIKAAQLIPELAEHPIDWRKPKYGDAVGRRILYRNTPAVVTSYIPDQGCIVARAERGRFPVPAYVEKDRRDDYYIHGDDGNDVVKEDIFSTDIWWFREKHDKPAVRQAKKR